MATSINGWPVLQPSSSKLVNKRVPGTSRSLTLRDDVAPLLLALASDYDRLIQSIDDGSYDDWGYSYRIARESYKWSDHSSGTAIDLNSAKEGRMGIGPYAWWKNYDRYKKAQYLKSKYEIVIWGGAASLGGNYRFASNYDWMHWSIAPGTSLARVQAQIRKLDINPDGSQGNVVNLSNVQPGRTNSDVLIVQKALKKEFPSFDYSNAPGTFGPKTSATWDGWEQRLKYANHNGVPDMNSLSALGRKYGFKTAS